MWKYETSFSPQNFYEKKVVVPNTKLNPRNLLFKISFTEVLHCQMATVTDALEQLQRKLTEELGYLR